MADRKDRARREWLDEHALLLANSNRRTGTTISGHRRQMAGALDGLVVIDLTSHLSGPYAAMMLADHGADVIKIEQQDGGDDARRMPPFIEGESAPFMVWNRNKRSVVLDLKSTKDKAKLLTLVDGADILIGNMRPGVMDKLGLGYATLSKRNPRLIYAAISGFGQTGPFSRSGGLRPRRRRPADEGK